LDYNRRNRIWL